VLAATERGPGLRTPPSPPLPRRSGPPQDPEFTSTQRGINFLVAGFAVPDTFDLSAIEGEATSHPDDLTFPVHTDTYQDKSARKDRYTHTTVIKERGLTCEDRVEDSSGRGARWAASGRNEALPYLRGANQLEPQQVRLLSKRA
jgi:hypothetical protein